jgi:predicted GNAT family acetyltransferase
MKITHKDEGNEGIFLAIEGDRIIGEMTYVWSGNNNFIIDHTEVIDEYEGQGVGKKLVEKAVEFARENGYTIFPQCSFVRHIFNRNPAYNDVLY